MKKRMSRPKSSEKSRHEFKVDSLLKRKESEIRDTETLNMDRFMNLTFLGYYDRQRNGSGFLFYKECNKKFLFSGEATRQSQCGIDSG